MPRPNISSSPFKVRALHPELLVSAVTEAGPAAGEAQALGLGTGQGGTLWDAHIHDTDGTSSACRVLGSAVLQRLHSRLLQ